MIHTDWHLTEAEARQLFRRELSVEGAFRAGLHIQLCPRCWDLAERVDPERFEAFARAYGLTRSYVGRRDRATQAEWMTKATQAQAQIEALSRKLERLPPERRRLLLQNLDSAPIQCKLITIARICKRLFPTSPREAIDLAELGLDLLGQTRTELGAEEALSFEASLLSHYGNGLRIVGELRKAEGLLRRAARLSRDVGDPLERAWAHRYLGYVLADRRRYSQALGHTRIARRLFSSVHDDYLAFETHRDEAKFLSDAGKYEQSVRLLTRLEDSLPAGRDSILELSIKSLLVLNHLHLGVAFHARGLLPRVKELASALGGIAVVRTEWLEALTLEAVGDLSAADRLLGRVCSELGTEYPYDLAVATLDRMRVLVRQRNLRRATVLLRDLIPLVKGARLHSQAVRALRLLAEQGIEAPIIRAIQDFLGKLQRDPSYTLEDANLPC